MPLARRLPTRPAIYSDASGKSAEEAFSHRTIRESFSAWVSARRSIGSKSNGPSPAAKPSDSPIFRLTATSPSSKAKGSGHKSHRHRLLHPEARLGLTADYNPAK